MAVLHLPHNGYIANAAIPFREEKKSVRDNNNNNNNEELNVLHLKNKNTKVTLRMTKTKNSGKKK